MAADQKMNKDMPKNTDLGTDMTVDSGKDMGKDLQQDTGKDIGEDMPTLCDNNPVDLQIDIDHCGVCDNQCDPDFSTCGAGSCICPPDAEPCGSDNTCKDTQNDPFNCGGCGISCGLAAECVAGSCVCLDGYRDCDGVCVNLDSDPNHCGECDEVCSGEKRKCNNGTCKSYCLGEPECKGSNRQVSCTDRDDYFHCNANFTDRCGEECGVGEACIKINFLTRKCLKIRPTIGCQTCPCDECSRDESCKVSHFAGREVFCVED